MVYVLNKKGQPLMPTNRQGRMSTGYAILMDIEGNKIDFSTMPKGYKTPKLSNCNRISSRKTTLVTQIIT